MAHGDRFGRDGWAAIVAAAASLAILVTPGVQSWYAAIPLWALAGAAAFRWVRVIQSHESEATEAIATNITDDEVRKPFQTLTSMQAQAVFEASFKGKRMKISGTVSDVSKHRNALPSMRYTVALKEYVLPNKSVSLWFAANQGVHVEHLQPGTLVVVVGTIDEASAHGIDLRNCRIMP